MLQQLIRNSSSPERAKWRLRWKLLHNSGALVSRLATRLKNFPLELLLWPG